MVEFLSLLAAVGVILTFALAVFLDFRSWKIRETKKLIYKEVVKTFKEQDIDFEESKEFKKTFKRSIRNYDLANKNSLLATSGIDDVTLQIIVNHIAKACA